MKSMTVSTFVTENIAVVREPCLPDLIPIFYFRPLGTNRDWLSSREKENQRGAGKQPEELHGGRVLGVGKVEGFGESCRARTHPFLFVFDLLSMLRIFSPLLVRC